MLELREPYEKRPIRFLEEWGCEGWRLKVYGIAYRRREPRAALVETAKRLARGRLPRPAVGGGRYGVGFVGVHQGRGANVGFEREAWVEEVLANAAGPDVEAYVNRRLNEDA